MKLDSRTSESKLFSRFKYSNGMPYVAEDIHGDSDNIYNKLNIILNNLVGTGLLETPTFSKVTSGSNFNIRITKPFAVNIEGDIFLVGSTDSESQITIANTFTGTLALVCWVSAINSSKTNYEYGFMRNKVVSMQDLINPTLSVQVSTRYQVRYDIVPITNVLDYNRPLPVDITLNNIITDAGTKNLTVASASQTLIGNAYTFNSSANIPSETGRCFIIPLANVTSGVINSVNISKNTLSVNTPTEPSLYKDGVIWYNPNSNESRIYSNGDWRSLGGIAIEKSDISPSNPSEGLVWYNSDTEEFKMYLDGIGFVTLNSLISILQLSGSYILDTKHTNSNITINIPISEYQSTDLLNIYYEGVVLSKDVHYTLNTANKTITLQGFTTEIGDRIQFTAIRIVNDDINSTSLEVLNNHLNLISTDYIDGHCKLSDSIDSSVLDISKGTAATPKAVNDVKKLINVYTDEVTGTKYKIKVSNAQVMLEEIL